MNRRLRQRIKNENFVEIANKIERETILFLIVLPKSIAIYRPSKYN